VSLRHMTFTLKKRFQKIVLVPPSTGGTAVAQWLICCATNRKVVGLIPAGVPGVDSASNRIEYQEFFLGVKSGQCVRLTTYHHPVPLSRNLGALTSLNPLGLSRPVMGLLYLFTAFRISTHHSYSWPSDAG